MHDVLQVTELCREEELSSQDRRRAGILEAARACFSLRGFHNASMQQICAAAKMSPGALYRYFPSKESIIEAIVDEEARRGARALALLHGEGRIHDRLLACGMAYLRGLEEQQCLQLKLEVAVEGLRSGTVGFKRIEQEIRTEFIAVLSEAQAKGEFGGDVDVELVASTLLAVGDGLAMRAGSESGLDLAGTERMLTRIIAAVLQ
ncbi:TetR/AcrR family transcriptional regulator [Oryzibacter oryziterrae]|uniref:TetR/AcrR family transcriptional regulator n=1 Tax=Oryzibacter oryziterrae TaxID=2766474 RepID=UPI001F3B347C|nr:TetR/AcrR family transcriptional regulator [Oryzibacter oryziterrae]